LGEVRESRSNGIAQSYHLFAQSSLLLSKDFGVSSFCFQLTRRFPLRYRQNDKGVSMLTTARARRLERRLQTLIENRSVFTMEQSELNLFETYQKCQGVELQFNEPIAVAMLEGKKVMRLSHQRNFDFLPHQLLFLPAREPMRIDFPEASMARPTRCLALAISPDLIRETANELNERFQKLDGVDWEMNYAQFYLGSDARISQTIRQLIQIFIDDEPANEMLASLKLRELLVRVMQTQARTLLLSQNQTLIHHSRLALAVDYIQNHLHERISIDDLCKKSCMSKPHFFRSFKQELGLTPIEFINQARIDKARQLLENPSLSISDVCFQSGFSSVAYFDRVFKQMVGECPKQYQSARKRPR
jgi:AraC-like DNA-binding protein